MPPFRTTFPWLLLSCSVALNFYLCRQPTAIPPVKSHTIKKSSLKSPAVSTPTTNHELSTTASTSTPFAPSQKTTPHSQPSTLNSTATRSSAFRGYADLLAEEIQTIEQLASLNELLARWVATAPTDAATWLAQHDDAPFYDPAARHIALHLVAKQNFFEAAIWADLIRDPALREEARDALIAEGYRAKKIDAQAVRLSGLSPAHIESILTGARLD